MRNSQVARTVSGGSVMKRVRVILFAGWDDILIHGFEVGEVNDRL